MDVLCIIFCDELDSPHQQVFNVCALGDDFPSKIFGLLEFSSLFAFARRRESYKTSFFPPLDDVIEPMKKIIAIQLFGDSYRQQYVGFVAASRFNYGCMEFKPG